MKKLIKTALLVLSSIVAFSQASPTQLNFAAHDTQPQTFTLSLNPNATWIISQPTWTNVSQHSGQGSATISVVPNEDNTSYSDTRSESITIITELVLSGGAISRLNLHVNITQAPSVAPHYIKLDTSALTVPNTSSANISGSFSLETFSDYWSLTKPDWLTVLDEGNEPVTNSIGSLLFMKVRATKNTSAQPRTGVITFIMDDNAATVTLTITQPADTVLTVTTTDITINNESGTSDSFSFSSNEAWTVSSPNWISVIDGSNNTITQGNAGTYDLRIQAQANDGTNTRIADDIPARTGTVTFTSGSVTKSITITQAGRTGTVTAIQDDAVNNTISVYPNPSSGQVNISGSFNTVNIYNSNGVKIQSTINPVVNLSQGLYLFELLSDKGERNIQKVIIE